MKSIAGYLSDMLICRLDDICNETASKSILYKELTDKIVNFQDEIMNCLPDGKKHLIEEYSDIESERQALIQTIIYRRGVDDGIAITDVVSKIKKMNARKLGKWSNK